MTGRTTRADAWKLDLRGKRSFGTDIRLVDCVDDDVKCKRIRNDLDKFAQDSLVYTDGHRDQSSRRPVRCVDSLDFQMAPWWVISSSAIQIVDRPGADPADASVKFSSPTGVAAGAAI